MEMYEPPLTFNESIMSKYIDEFVRLAEDDIFGDELIDAMVDKFDLRALPTLIMLCGDGDFYMHTLFSRFKISSLVRATYNVKSTNYAVDTDFLKKLSEKAFWQLNLKQVTRLSVELTYLFPNKFSYLKELKTDFVNEGALS